MAETRQKAARSAALALGTQAANSRRQTSTAAAADQLATLAGVLRVLRVLLHVASQEEVRAAAQAQQRQRRHAVEA